MHKTRESPLLQKKTCSRGDFCGKERFEAFSLLVRGLGYAFFWGDTGRLPAFSPCCSSLCVNPINLKKGRICLPIQRKAVLLQADYYLKRIKD